MLFTLQLVALHLHQHQNVARHVFGHIGLLFDMGRSLRNVGARSLFIRIESVVEPTAVARGTVVACRAKHHVR